MLCAHYISKGLIINIYIFSPVYTITFWARLALGTVPRFVGTARLQLPFCRVGLKIGTGPSTGVARLSHTDLFHGTAECLHLRKSWHGTANRGAETDIFGSARHGRRACTVYTLSKFAVPCRKRRCPFKINEVKIQFKYIWFVLVGVCCGLEEGDS